MPTTPDPWERLPEESGQAYAAFEIYRDLGVNRTLELVVQALKAAGGRRRGVGGAAKRAPGYLNRWSKDHRWVERSKAYDDHRAREKRKALDLATRKTTEEWVSLAIRQMSDDLDLGRKLLERANALASLPVVRKTVTEDGHTTIVEPASPEHLRAASLVAARAHVINWNVLDRALGIDPKPDPAVGVPPPPAPPDDVAAEARRRVEAHRAEMRAKMLTMSDVPPKDGDGEP